jgi:hypothetical protein
MPIFIAVGPEARDRLIKTARGYQERQVYRENLANLVDGTIWEIAPEEGESLRKIKLSVRRAANELDLPAVRYGETPSGTLLVWAEESKRRAARRGRPRQVVDPGTVHSS